MNFKKVQKIKRVQKKNAKKVIILIREFNVAIILTARKNIIKMQRFKKLIICKVISEKNKKILRTNDF